jgi:hypothetical protein
MRSRRSLRRHTAVAGAVCLLLAAVAGCGPAEATGSPADTVRSAVDRMTAEESATVTAEIDAPVSEVRALLSAFGQDTGKRRAEWLARAEVAVALEADRPLNELEEYGPQTRLAVGLSFGDRDVVAYKSVGDLIYLRLQPGQLLRNGTLTRAQRERLREVLDLAGELPDSLKATKRLLGGGWVSMRPGDFADYGWALQRFTGLSVDKQNVRGASSVLDGGELRATLGRLEDVLTRHSTFHEADKNKGNLRMRAQLPARRTAKALAPLLRPLGAGFGPRKVPDRRVPAELVVRRGSLSELTLDLGALAGGGSAEVPLRLRFSPGDVYSPKVPGKAIRLEPQDLLVAALYGASRPQGGGEPPRSG